jgi:hypothetical protein
MRIRWTDPAVQDFTNICDYIEQHASSETARRLAITIYTAIGTLDRWLISCEFFMEHSNGLDQRLYSRCDLER